MNPAPLTLRGRGILAPSLSLSSERAPRVARLEPWAEEFGPLLAHAPELASLLADICIAHNLRDESTLAQRVHEAESLLSSLAWDWGPHSTLINPVPPSSGD